MVPMLILFLTARCYIDISAVVSILMFMIMSLVRTRFYSSHPLYMYTLHWLPRPQVLYLNYDYVMPLGKCSPPKKMLIQFLLYKGVAWEGGGNVWGGDHHHYHYRRHPHHHYHHHHHHHHLILGHFNQINQKLNKKKQWRNIYFIIGSWRQGIHFCIRCWERRDTIKRQLCVQWLREQYLHHSNHGC